METLTTTFFSEPSLKRILTYLCNSRAPGSWDPVTATVLDLLTGNLQFCLSSIGLIPFKGHANSADNVADLLTKPLLKAAFLPLRKRIMGF
jgi:hypothetical protein